MDDPKKCKPCSLLVKDNRAVRWVMSNGVSMGLCEKHAAPYRFGEVDLTSSSPPNGSPVQGETGEPPMPQRKHVNTGDIAADYKERGQGVSEIAERRQLSMSTVNYHLKKAGVTLDHTHRKKRNGAGVSKNQKPKAHNWITQDSIVWLSVTEQKLDQWWASLAPSDKGKVFLDSRLTTES